MTTRTSGKKRIEKPQIIIVEGNHERDFFTAWVKFLSKDIQVMPIGGKTQFKNELMALTKEASFPTVSHLLIVRDADDNPKGAFQSIRDALTKAGLSAPPYPFMFTQRQMPDTSIAIVPAIDQHGALEELLLQTVDSDPLTSAAEQFIDNSAHILRQSGYRQPPPKHKQGKAKVHAFLATFEEPDKDLGKAALAGVRNFSHSALEPLRALLQSM